MPKRRERELPATRAPFLVLHAPRRSSCCSPCDALAVHFADDNEVHIYVTTTEPERLAHRLKRLLAHLMEHPSTVRALAGVEDVDEVSQLVRRND